MPDEADSGKTVPPVAEIDAQVEEKEQETEDDSAGLLSGKAKDDENSSTASGSFVDQVPINKGAPGLTKAQREFYMGVNLALLAYDNKTKNKDYLDYSKFNFVQDTVPLMENYLSEATERVERKLSHTTSMTFNK